MESFHTGQVVYHAEHGTGRVVNIDDEAGRVIVNFIKAGVKSFGQDEAGDALSDTPFETDIEEEDEMDTDQLKDAIRQVLLEEGVIGKTAIGGKWEGGELVIKPGSPGLQEKPVPIGTFFHKIVMVRNQLRMLEQNINANTKLTDAEKVDMQQYITRCYGSLTTFNVLFADKSDWFVGSRKD